MFNTFFSRLSIHALVAKLQNCAMVHPWRFFKDFLRRVFSSSRVQHISNLHSKFALDHIMSGSMVDIQAATAENRRGKRRKRRRKRRRKKKPQDKNRMACPIWRP